MIWERLYELSDKSILHISREADEGWNYALYHRCSIGEYTLADGGYIENSVLPQGVRNSPLGESEGDTTDPIDDIAYISTQLLGTSAPVKTSLTVKEFQEYIKQVPDAIHRGVNIFLSPELKSAGIEAIPESLLTEIRQAIDRRLSQDILLIYNPLRGYSMHFIDPEQVSDDNFYPVNLPDTVGHLHIGDHVSLNEIGEYDEHWALRLWLDPVYIELRAGDFVFDMD